MTLNVMAITRQRLEYRRLGGFFVTDMVLHAQNDIRQRCGEAEARKFMEDFVGMTALGRAGFPRLVVFGSLSKRSNAPGMRSGYVAGDAALHERAIGAHAGLAGVAVLGDHGALDGAVEVGVVEDDEGCVAAQFERDLLDLPQHVETAAIRQLEGIFNHRSDFRHWRGFRLF